MHAHGSRELVARVAAPVLGDEQVFVDLVAEFAGEREEGEGSGS